MEMAHLHKLFGEVGGGGAEIGAEAQAVRRRAEEEVLIALNIEYGGTLLLGDALHQFYMDTVRELSRKQDEFTRDEVSLFAFHWHVLSASRFYVAYDLYRRGYYFECTALARSLWETALTLAALKRGIVSLGEVFVGEAKPGETLLPREMMDRIRRVDSRIQRVLIWKNTELGEAERKAVNTFLDLGNQATHKSKLGMAARLGLSSSDYAVAIFPRFDRRLTEMSWNILFIALRCLMETLLYLQPFLPPSDSPWGLRYQKLLLAFDEMQKTAPNVVLLGFGAVIAKVFRAT